MRKFEMTSLARLCNLNMGQSPASESYNTKQDGLPFYQGNADFGNIHPHARIWCNNPNKIAEANDILLSVRAPIGALNIAKEKCCIGRGLAALSPIPSRCRLMYLFYALKSKVKILERQGTGSTFKAVGKDKIGALQIPFYDLEEQEHIINQLTCIDAGIRNLHTQLVKLDTLVKSRFIEMFGDLTLPIVHVEDICSDIVDCPHTTPKYQGELLYPAIRTTEIKEGYIDWTTMKYVAKDEYDKRISRLKPLAGDIVYGREGTYGNAAILPEGYDFCLGQRVMLFRTDMKKCLPLYLLQALISDDVKRQADSKNTGSTVAHVNVADAKKFTIPLPPIDLQNQFAAFVQQVDKSKSVLQKLLEKQELLRAALMQEYFG